MAQAQIPLKKTKIVCTIGPASASQEVLEQMILNGMNIARINFAHGDHEGHRAAIQAIRAASQATGRPISIFGDLPGPKMRIGLIEDESIDLERGQSFILQSDPIVGNRERVSMSFDKLAEVVKPGDDIFLNDGFIQLQVDRVVGTEVQCTVIVGGELRSHKGVNFPGIDLGISAFTQQDRQHLAFAAEQKLDAVSVSFVERGADIEAVRAAAEMLNYAPFIIAKIERSGAYTHLDDILRLTDGIMVARGDLGVEIPVAEIAQAQKKIIAQAKRLAVPVITATHMLESMITNSRPTRAEVTDVANAILDGTDCVMLSGESAIGRFPADTVAMMARIAEVTEANAHEIGIADILRFEQQAGKIEDADLISLNIYLTQETVNPTLVFVPSHSGETARRVTRFRLPTWIIAFSASETTCQRLQFSYGVLPIVLSDPVENWIQFVRDWVCEIDAEGERVLLAQGAGTLGLADTSRIDIIGIDSTE